MHNLLAQDAHMVLSGCAPSASAARPVSVPSAPCLPACGPAYAYLVPSAQRLRSVLAWQPTVLWPGLAVSRHSCLPSHPVRCHNTILCIVTQPPNQSSLQYNPGLAALVRIQILYRDTVLFPANCLQYKTFL